MKSTATASNKESRPAANPHSLAAVKYQKVYDGRKRRVRGLWKRGGTFYAQLSLPDADGNRRVRRVPLEANTTASAADELRRMMIKRNYNQLPAMVQNPRFDHFAQEYLEREYALGRKTLKTLGTESGHINFWTSVIGETRLNRITPKLIQGGLIRRKGTGVSPRTLNICLTVLRNVLRGALQEGWLLDSPARTVQWQKVPTKKRPLFSSQQLESMCESAVEVSKNGPLFCDFIRFLCYSGARMGEALSLSWADVDWDNGQLIVGADGQTKNREFRALDFNPCLKSHLESMRQQRTQDLWLFPSPQRGREGRHASSLRETLILSRNDAGLEHVRFHDCRHHFISYCVMSGIDFMTIAKWVGHRDGGMLIGRTYGHLANEHTKRAAQKVSFG